MHAQEPEHQHGAPPVADPVARTKAPSEAPAPSALVALQRRIGNTAVAGMMSGQPEHPVQRSTAHDVLGSAGRPLDAPVRDEMEARLGADFSDVRVHTDTAAQRSAAEMGARAYTSGNHVVVGSGGGDRHTLAHELVHVIQQRSGPVSTTARDDGVAVSDPGDSFERAAEAEAHRVMSRPVPDAQGHAHTHESHAGHAHPAVQRAPVVQRMTMNDFTQLLAQHDVANDPDFVTFFEIRLARTNPVAVVNDPAPGSANRLQRLLQSPEVNPALVGEWAREYRRGAEGVRTQPTTLSDPNITGLEVELSGSFLDVLDGTVENKESIAHTAATTPDLDMPMLKLVVEGMDRTSGIPTIELVYGPLPTARYADDDLLDSREKLKQAFGGGGNVGLTVSEIIEQYNKSLKKPENGDENPFELVPTPSSDPEQTAPATRLAKRTKTTPNTNVQSNVSTPYVKVGGPRPPAAPGPGQGGIAAGRGAAAGRARGRGGAPAGRGAAAGRGRGGAQAPAPLRPGDFTDFFKPSARERDAYTLARAEAVKLQNAVNDNWRTRHNNAGNLTAGPNVRALFTQQLHQEAKYRFHSFDREVVADGDKHHFDVLIKASVQDVVMTVLNDDEARLLLAWLVDWRATPLAEAAMRVFEALGGLPGAGFSAAKLHGHLTEVLVTRLLAGRQLLETASDDTRTSRVFGENREVGTVAHIHPRPSSRVKVTVHGQHYYIVVEERDHSHPVNSDAESDPRRTTTTVRSLQSL
ncbi:eCIS core domain-containing protein [Saccharothrix luteola]|uniref:eCIS core domain-containing protein n=1 Tax=Saccharothrix luteola TaxID=2893018 RepID=UPI001E3F8C1B|nr:DUF4157 domain-containing protein [Saccharothrix luteola]MCC8249583.1 DUF4157 domain-containing protein [Saccharothrix luteola]